jgi:protein TonB
MKRNSPFHRTQPRVSPRRLRPNLLDLEKPARSDRPALYWSSLVAAIVFHGGLLSYLIGHERLPADHAAADPAMTSGQVAQQPLAKRDREGAPAGGEMSATREELIARVAASSDYERLRAPPPDVEEIYVTVPVQVQPVAAERPKKPAKALETRIAMAAGEEKTSVRNADPRFAEAAIPEGDREPEPTAQAQAQTPVTVPDDALPEDRGAAGIVDVPPDPSRPQQADSAPQTETPSLAEETPAAVAVDSPDMPAPEAGAASVADEKSQTSEQAATEASPAPAAAAEPVPEPDRPAETQEVAKPQQPLPEDGGTAIVALPAGPDPAPEPEPAAEAHRPLPEVAALSAPGVDAPDMPLPRRRPVFAKAAEDAQTGGTTSATDTGEEKAGKTGDAVESYRQKVRERLAEFKPIGAVASGTVVVSFTLSKSGAVSSAKILRSSGEAELDESVLAAVRRAAPFPKTPPGTRAAQRRFVIPFLFQS